MEKPSIKRCEQNINIVHSFGEEGRKKKGLIFGERAYMLAYSSCIESEEGRALKFEP